MEPLAELFPALASSPRPLDLSESARVTYALQWALVPLHFVLFLVALLLNASAPLRREPIRATEWLVLLACSVLGIWFVLSSIGIGSAPTFMNGRLLFSSYARPLPVDGVPGQIIVAWGSAMCELVMLFLAVLWLIVGFQLCRIRRAQAQQAVQGDGPASGGSAP
ncbi:hypothetical protein A7R78_33330 [Pseudomonas aeruginosa]|nr:hypothetical protein A7R78_33330 [Pseudomonas aeruginosa]